MSDQKKQGSLYLVPMPISEGAIEVIPKQVLEALRHIEYFLAEDVRTARRFLSSLRIYQSIEALHFETLDKDTPKSALKELTSPLHKGFDIGILSESGCPGIADPGSIAVAFAHQHKINVIPLVGPSSIILALMASGLNGQQFAFHGYLPIDSKEATKVISGLEKESKTKNQTQIFIETPYRNNQLLDHLLKALNTEARLCIALDVTGPEQFIQTMTIKEWKDNKPTLPKLPCVFLFLAY